ncbi:MAG: DUF3575 domain-containing protein [Alistipes sp.]|jgi:hypothetical protein|nr:DUF3575 domain-containing protein [Alistipes sp.]
MKKLFLTLAMLFVVVAVGRAQKLAVKTNAVGWLSAMTTNVGIETTLWPKLTIAADGYFNPVADWGNNKSTRLWAVQPELKYWLGEEFVGHYFGAHGQFSEFDAGLFRLRYEGQYWGAGLSYGYSMPIADCWHLDFSLGLGWKHWEGSAPGGRLDPYYRAGASDWDDKEFRGKPLPGDTFGFTKVSASVVFIIK